MTWTTWKRMLKTKICLPLHSTTSSKSLEMPSWTGYLSNIPTGRTQPIVTQSLFRIMTRCPKSKFTKPSWKRTKTRRMGIMSWRGNHQNQRAMSRKGQNQKLQCLRLQSRMMKTTLTIKKNSKSSHPQARLRWKDNPICPVSTRRVRREWTKSIRVLVREQAKSQIKHQIQCPSSRLLSNNKTTI